MVPKHYVYDWSRNWFTKGYTSLREFESYFKASGIIWISRICEHCSHISKIYYIHPKQPLGKLRIKVMSTLDHQKDSNEALEVGSWWWSLPNLPFPTSKLNKNTNSGLCVHNAMLVGSSFSPVLEKWKKFFRKWKTNLR